MKVTILIFILAAFVGVCYTRPYLNERMSKRASSKINVVLQLVVVMILYCFISAAKNDILEALRAMAYEGTNITIIILWITIVILFLHVYCSTHSYEIDQSNACMGCVYRIYAGLCSSIAACIHNNNHSSYSLQHHAYYMTL